MRDRSTFNAALDYERVAFAIHYLNERFKEQPTLKDVASAVGLSEFHFQRLFRRWAGISPKRFLQFLTAERARSVLIRSRSVLEATYDAGLSSPGRLHDLCVNIHAATPAQVRDAGADLKIRFGLSTSPFGECLIARSDRGVIGLDFVKSGQHMKALDGLRKRWAAASFVREDKTARQIAMRVFGRAKRSDDLPLTLFVQGTNFQIRVWEALVRIPVGNMLTYGDVAADAGNPGANRAVGSAVGANPIGYIIPCHRVILKSGAFGEYRWGSIRKHALLGWELAREAETRKDIE